MSRAETAKTETPPKRGRRPHVAVLVTLALALLLLALVAGGVRFGVRTESGRAFAMRALEGLRIGRVGRLHVEGLEGDIFGAFRLRKLEIVDEKGPWLQAENLSVSWRPFELSAGRLHAEQIAAEQVKILRRPVQTPPEDRPPGDLPVSIFLDEVKLQLATDPDFSETVGLWDVAGKMAFERRGPATGTLDAQSRLNAGDGVRVAYRFGPDKRLLLQADAVEQSGGALAGSIGLPSNRRLLVHARVDGAVDGEGALEITAESGPIRPITATGRWGPDGASLDAQVLLSASRLTAEYAERVGPEATIRLRASPLEGDLVRIDGRAVARDASVIARGPIDWRERSSEGLDLRLAVSDVERWVEPLKAGPARAAGSFSGTLRRWRYAGRLEVDRLDQWGFKAANFSGPAVASRVPGEVRLQADLRGRGGEGRGLIPALLGATPRIKLDGARLADGRLLARELEVSGAGLELQASGDRSLLGALTFKGDLQLTGLDRAHDGATGAVRASWTANQRGDSPWRFRFDARGRDFASGYAELDRLLGAEPTLEGEATYGDDGLAVSRSELAGEAASASIQGRLEPDNTLSMGVDWQASGPFAVGPIEIAGRASGTGRLGGNIQAPWVDLTADLQSVDFGRLKVTPARLTLLFATEGEVNGQVSLSGSSAYGPATGRAGFRFVPGGVALTDIAADAGGVKAGGALTLRDGAPSSADLTVEARAGAFLTGGELSGTVVLAEAPGGAQARIALDGRAITADGLPGSLRTLRVRANGPWTRLPFAVQAEGDQPTLWRFLGDGVLTQAPAPGGTAREVALNGTGRLRTAELRTEEPIRVRFAPGERSIRARLGVAEGRLAFDAREAGGRLEATGQTQNLEISPFNQEFVGRVTASLRLSGQEGRLDGEVDAALAGARNRDAPEDVALNGRVRAVLADTRIDIDAAATNQQGLTSQLKMNVPAEATASPFRVALIRNRPVSGSFAAQGELRPLWDLFIGGGRTLSGRGTAQGTIGGTLADLDSTGEARLENGRFQDAATGLEIRDLNLVTEFGDSAIRVERFSGRDDQGGGLSGTGVVNLDRGGASTFSLQLDRFQLIDNDLARAVASGAVTVTRDAEGKAKLEGALDIVRADIIAEPPVPTGVVPLEVVEVNKPPANPQDFQVRPPGPQVALDVHITADRGVFVRGNGLDMEFSVDARVGGATGDSTLTGLARVVRGDYQFAGKRFEFDESSLVRLGSRAELIRLDMTARREDPTLTAVVRIEGTAARPEVTLSSIPVLPQDEVLSQVLFGRTASQLSPFETAQLASALTSLATGGGLDVLGGLREFARLDMLALGGDESGQAVVSGGKYLTDDVYLELTGGGRNGPTAQVEWRVRRNFSVVSTVATQGDARLSVRFRKGF